MKRAEDGKGKGVEKARLLSEYSCFEPQTLGARLIPTANYQCFGGTFRRHPTLMRCRVI